MKGLYRFESVIEAAQMLHATAPKRLHQLVEHLPMIFVKGKKKLSEARRATAADILTESGQWSVANDNPFKKMKNTE